MVQGRIIGLILAVLSVSCRLFAAASTEQAVFEAAADKFNARFYEQAETGFAEFVERFTNSTRIPEAIFFQAEARVMQSNYAGAIELLTQKLPQAGTWADSYMYWLGEAYLRKGDFTKAGEQFANLIRQFPTSPRRLEAALGETVARSKLGEWDRVIELLQQTNGVFQIAARANATNELALRGYLFLGEAHVARKNFSAAEAAIQPIQNLSLGPRLAWQRQHLLTRIDLGLGNFPQALPGLTNLLTLSTNTTDKSLIAESISIYAGVLERLGRADEAMNAYEKNLADGFPAERQGQALLKLAELSLSRNRVADAARVLERFCVQDRDSPSRQQALLILGELRMRQHMSSTNAPVAPPPQAATGTNAPAGTNASPTYLQQALTALNTLRADYPRSPLLGRAQLNLGWCHWLAADLPQAQAAFQAAADQLSESFDQAVAIFKLADCNFRANDFGAAVTNYNRLLSRYAGSQEVRAELFEPALYQVVRAAIAAGDIASATENLAKLLDWYPTGFHTERAVLIAGQSIAAKSDPAKAREIYQGFAERATNAALLPEVRLAIARTHEQEGAWNFAIAEYDHWVGRFTNAPSRARAEYLRAWANFQAGNETNAFSQFTNFVARYPKEQWTPLAQWWVADHYYRNGRWREAEENYQLLYKSTNWPTSELSYQAQLMAGRTAAARQGWSDAIQYLTTLTSNPKCPADIRAQATFAYGNVLMLRSSENKLEDYSLAIGVYNAIIDSFPTNPIAVLALGEKASCLMQWARTGPQYDAAAAEFQKILTNSVADATARGIARFGLAVVLEKQAALKQGAEQTALLKRALDLYLDVFVSKDVAPGAQPNLYWMKRAGTEAGRLAEAMQLWPQAIELYEGLNRLAPALRASTDRKLAKARENLAKSRP